MQRFVAVGVLLVVVYVAAAWGLGRAAHARFDAWEQELGAQQPIALLKIAERKYSPGVLSSVEVVTFELDRNLWNAVKKSGASDDEEIELPEEDAAAMQEALKALAMLEEDVAPLRLTVSNRVLHGPLPGFAAIGLARIESTLVLDEPVRAQVAAILGDREPIVVDTLLGFTGAGRVDVTGAAFEMQVQEGSLSWQGIHGRLTYGRNLNSFTCDVLAPGLDAKLSGGVDFHLGKIELECDLKRAFGPLYAGTSAFRIDALRGSFQPDAAPMVVEGMRYSGDVGVNGEYVDLAMEFGINDLQVPQLAMTDVHYDIAINHLHAPTYTTLMSKFEELGTPGAVDASTDATATMNALTAHALQLLEHSPQIVIKRIGFTMPEGQLGMTGTVQLKSFAKADLESPLAVLQKIDATADLWFTEGLLDRDWGSTAGAADPTMPPAQDRAAALRSQVARLEQMRYLQRKDNRLESHLELRDGTLTANGKPFGPGVQ